MVGTNVLRLTLSDSGRPRVGKSDVPLEMFFDGMKRVVFVDDKRDIERLESGDLAVALGSSVGKTLPMIRRAGIKMGKAGAVGLLVHERVITNTNGSSPGPEGHFPVVVIDRDVEWADVLQPLVRIDIAARGPRADAEARRTELVHDILMSGGKISVDSDMALASGLDLSLPMRMFYVTPVGELDRSLRSRLEEAVGFELLDHDPRGTVIPQGSAIVGLETQSALGTRRERLGASLMLRARSTLGLTDVMVGIGAFRSGVQGIFRSFREARWAAEVGFSLHGPNHVMDFERLGAFSWLEPIDFERGPEATQAIEMILARDKSQGTRLLETLQAFLETRRLKEAADKLFIHRNTLRYRLDAISKLTGLDVQDPDARLVLEMQMRLAIVRGLIGRGALQTGARGADEVVIELDSSLKSESSPIL
jgi:PucR C-terminal helix-turn-helix domain/GGDEF-like domain